MTDVTPGLLLKIQLTRNKSRTHTGSSEVSHTVELTYIFYGRWTV